MIPAECQGVIFSEERFVRRFLFSQPERVLDCDWIWMVRRRKRWRMKGRRSKVKIHTRGNWRWRVPTIVSGLNTFLCMWRVLIAAFECPNLESQVNPSNVQNWIVWNLLIKSIGKVKELKSPPVVCCWYFTIESHLEGEEKEPDDDPPGNLSLIIGNSRRSIDMVIVIWGCANKSFIFRSSSFTSCYSPSLFVLCCNESSALHIFF